MAPVTEMPPTVEFEDSFSKRVDEWLTQELAPAFRNPIPLNEFASESPLVTPPPSSPTRETATIRRGVSSRSRWFRRRGELRSETYMSRLARVWMKRAAIALLSVAALGAAVSAAAQLPGLTGRLMAPAQLPAAPAPPTLAAPGPVLTPPIEAPATPTPPVEPRALELPPVVMSSAVVPGNYFVAVALFATQERADRLVQSLAQAGFPVVQRPLQLRTQRLQQVVLGPFVHRSDAVVDLQRLRQLGGYDDAAIIDPTPAPAVP
jgi:hypothetical protein